MRRALLIDSGNTRVKLALAVRGAEGFEWTDVSIDQAQLGADGAALDASLAPWLAAGPPEAVAAVNVAGPAAGAAIAAALARAGLANVSWLTARPEACGVANGYAAPESLGADRWAGLIGTHRGFPGRDAVVASFGTATTIDAITREGRFLGGLILPGLDLMRRSLAQHTAQLPATPGRAVELPTCTEDAIMSGCVQAQAGALAAQVRAMAARTGRVPLLVATGGSAETLLPWLPAPFELRPRLVLEGLLFSLMEHPGAPHPMSEETQ